MSVCVYIYIYIYIYIHVHIYMYLVQTLILKFADNLSDCNFFFLNELYRLVTHYQRRKLKLARHF